MNKLKTFMYGLFLLSSLSLVTPVLANDIYITQSGDDLDLDITQASLVTE